MIRYRNMLAYQYSSIQADGEGDVATCLAQMLAIYQTVNADFAVHGFTDFMSMDYLASFERRFGSLDTKARRHLWAMLGRAEGLTDNPMEEARCLLSRVGIAVTDDGLNAARRIMCEARSAAAGDTKREMYNAQCTPQKNKGIADGRLARTSQDQEYAEQK